MTRSINPSRAAPPLPALLALVGVLLAVPAGPLQAQQSGDTASVLEGVFTGEQAERGAGVFEAECSFCHSPAEFRGTLFRITWVGRDVGALFSQLRATMPLDNPGGLTPEQYAAVVAYILQLNEYPTGEAALPSDPEALSRIRIETSTGSRR